MYVSVTFSSSESGRNFVWPGEGQFNPGNGIDTEHAKMDSEALEAVLFSKRWLGMNLWQINAMLINSEFHDILQTDSVEAKFALLLKW